jgi:hypothetical protein
VIAFYGRRFNSAAVTLRRKTATGKTPGRLRQRRLSSQPARKPGDFGIRGSVVSLPTHAVLVDWDEGVFMFSFFLERKKLFSFGVACAIALALFSACVPDEGTEIGVLTGYWKSSYGDGFEITGNTFIQYDDADKNISFAGEIVNNPDLQADSGSITLKITDSGTWSKTVECYIVVKWRGLSSSGVEQATASNYPSDLAPGKPIQEEAETLYTEENGYFGTFGVYQKQ